MKLKNFKEFEETYLKNSDAIMKDFRKKSEYLWKSFLEEKKRGKIKSNLITEKLKASNVISKPKNLELNRIDANNQNICENDKVRDKSLIMTKKDGVQKDTEDDEIICIFDSKEKEISDDDIICVFDSTKKIAI
jgi:hypothetical protein